MIARVSPYSEWTKSEDPYHIWVKVAHRARRGVDVHFGGHAVSGGDLLTLRGWYPIEVLHFPLRTLAQSRRKYLALSNGGRPSGETSVHTERARSAIETNTWEARYAQYLVADVDEAGTGRPGSPTRDTRLRNALRQLAGAASLPFDESLFVPPLAASSALEFPAFDVAESALFWHDLQPFVIGGLSNARNRSPGRAGRAGASSRAGARLCGAEQACSVWRRARA